MRTTNQIIIMRNSTIIIWLLGVGLIVLLCVLTADLFRELRLLVLDGVVLICVYSLFIYVYGGLYYNKEEFARDVPAAGVRIPSLWCYSILAFIGIVLGRVYSVSFSWQTFYQMCFLFLMIIGLLISKASTDRLHKIADDSQQLQQSKEELLDVAHQLRTAASVDTSLEAELVLEIKKLVERVGYISPNTSPLAKNLDNLLKGSICNIYDMLNKTESNDMIYSELDKAQSILSQRLKY